MKYFSMVLAAVLAFSIVAGAQNQLPPGTRAPDDQPSGEPAAAGSPQAAGHASGLPEARELSEAEDKINNSDFDGARPLVEKYLNQHPADARALFDLGYLEQAVHHEDAAIKNYGKAIAADPKQFESRLALGLLLAKQGKMDDARQQLVQATLLTPAPPNPAAQAQAYRALAAMDRTSDPSTARDELLSALRISPETPQDLLLTAQIAEGAGDEETAESAYRQVLNRYPQSSLSSEATGGLVHLLIEEQKYADAEPLVKSSLARDPDDPALNAQLATALISQGKNDEALPVLEKLHQLEPDNDAVNHMLADAYGQAGHPEKAEPIYAAMAAAQPNDPEVLSAQGRNLILEKRYVDAQKVLERSVQLKPDDGDAWSSLAFAAVQNKESATALQALSMRAKYLPETPSSYFLRAISYDNLRQTRAAEEYYHKFLAVAGGKFPDEEWQANQRLAILGRSH